MVLLHQASVQAVFSRVIAAERSHPAQTVSVNAVSHLKGKTTRTSYDETFIRPDKLKLRVREGGGDHTFFFSGNTMTGYEPLTNQRLLRKGLTGGFGDRINQALGAFDPLAILPADPSVAESFLGSLKAKSGWQLGGDAKQLRVSRTTVSGSKRAQSEIVFSRQSMLPLRMSFAQSGSDYVTMSYSYGPAPSSVSLTIPAGAKLVDSFSVHRALPKFLSAAASEESKACIRSYGSLRSVEFKVQGEAESNLVRWSGARFGQDSANVRWAWNGSQLAVLDKRRKRLYRGKPHGRNIGDYLAPLGTRVDPTLRLLINGRNPLEALFTPATTVRLAGRMRLNGVGTSILELRSPGLRVQVEIRSDNHLISGVVSESINESGKTVTSSRRTFEYLKVNRPIAPSDYEIAGTPLSLSTLKA